MRGREVFYPIGWDDNGLPSERRVQNYYGVTCDPTLPYDPRLVPPGPVPPRQASRQPLANLIPVSRRNFTELCRELTASDERAYERTWRQLGLSVDWSTSYRTIDAGPSATGQRAFLRALADGSAYPALGPVLWDTTYRTAVAQAEIEDREQPGHLYRLGFGLPGGGEVVIATTRPELLPACVALVAHPADERYRALFGRTARTPLFGVNVPILPHHLADPDKGTGIAMVCTFGDVTDVTWWRDLALPARPVLGPDGALLRQPPEAITSYGGRAAYARLAGLPARQARARAADLLRAAGAVRVEPAPVTHAVKFYEKGDAPLEIITARQWFLRSGGTDGELRERLLARGRDLAWHPPHMRARYDNWVTGLTGDWLISRQRYFGVPIPLWYPIAADGTPDLSNPIIPGENDLPVDPATDPPPGYRHDARDVPGGFTADPDVMDTWATSSLTPQIAGGWPGDEDLFGRVFPMDLRPQAHEIIRTWLFYTVLRADVLHGELPWRHAAISGWIVDPDRKKMSKSSGNVTTPADLLARYGSDAVRYWAAGARLGVDTAFDLAQIKNGRRLATKLLNASRFALAFGEREPAAAAAPQPLDAALLDRLAEVVARCTAALQDYDYASALETAESFFWNFCDDYLELVKPRAYGAGPGADVAVITLRTALSALLRLFAPVLPFVTEEIWSWWHDGSIHRAPWPDPGDYVTRPAHAGTAATPGPAGHSPLDAATEAIGAIRKAKSERRLSMRAPVDRLRVTGPTDRLRALESVLADVSAAGLVEHAELVPSPAAEISYEVTLTG